MSGDWSAIWIFALVFGGFRLLPVLDGWSRLAARYPASVASGESFEFVPATVRGVGMYLRVVVAHGGIRMDVWWFRPWHPPVFIPWNDVIHCGPSGLLSGNATLVCRGAENVAIRLVGRAGRAVLAEWRLHH